jgi:SAM-dependent methyltransferase
MRADWNERAKEDAHYYVAFGRRGQDEQEFYATAEEVVKGLVRELKRLGPGRVRARRALEIGCGPGRLLRPMSRYFGEIHGVDVSDEMIRLGSERLRDIPHAHAHATSGTDLAAFADESFDFVYSYAVFQHIPNREVVLEYLSEARRVMKPGAVLRCQLNGLPDSAPNYDTWCGVRIPAAELLEFFRERDFQVLALEGASTQYMWTTVRKRAAGWSQQQPPAPEQVRLRRITNAHSSEPVVPSRGRFASISLWFENLNEEADVHRPEIFIGGSRASVFYIGAAERDGLRQVNAMLSPGLETGFQPVEIRWGDKALSPPAKLRVIPPPPLVPRVVALSDGINLVSGKKIVTGAVKVTLEEVTEAGEFKARIGGRDVRETECFCTDPGPPRYEVNFKLPEGMESGTHLLEMRLGTRGLAAVEIEVG